MRGNRCAFFASLASTPLVRHGVDFVLADHRLVYVYQEMMLTIAANYSSAPDVRTMTLSELRLFYNGIRETLRAMSKPSK